MRKIALLLAIAMLFVGSIALVSCSSDGDDVSKSSKSAEDRAKDATHSKLALQIAVSTLNGSKISMSNCTYTTVKKLDNGNFKISGKVKVRDQYGDFHTANYDSDVTYDKTDDSYIASVKVGSFKKD